jgi:hypothetical protein
MEHMIGDPWNFFNLHKIKESFIASHIMRKKEANIFYVIPHSNELPHHVFIGMKTIIYETIDLPNLRQNRYHKIPGVPDM